MRLEEGLSSSSTNVLVSIFESLYDLNFNVLKRPTALLMAYICAKLEPNAVVEYFNNAACPAR